MLSADDLLRALLGPLAAEAGRAAAVDPVAAWAASGGMWLTGRPGGPPLAAGNGAGAVTSVLLDAVRAMAPPGADIPGVAVLGERAAVAGLRRGGAVSPGGAARLLRATDGYVALSVPRPDDLDLVPALVASDDVSGEPWGAITRWAADLPAAEVVGRARLLGMAVAELAEGGLDGGPVVRSTAGGARRKCERPLVVDLSSLWAGPLCAHLLGRAGADVVKVESAGRPDGARRGPALFFDLLHGGSRSVALDLHEREGVARLRELVARADVVITSSRRRAWEAWGIDPAAIAATGAVWVAITAHGLDEQADLVGFGDDVAVAAGLVGRDADGPVFAGDALADPLTGLAAVAATLAALRNGVGHVLDVAMARVAGVAARMTVAAPAAVEGPDGWSIDIGDRRVPVVPPAVRHPTGAGPILGADNDVLLSPA